MLENTVTKIGGSCLKSEEDFSVVADFLISEHDASGEPVPVVVSAMHGETRRLRDEARRHFPDNALLQVKHVAENGEFTSVQKLCAALRERGASAAAADPWMLSIEAEEAPEDVFDARLSGAKHECVEQFVVQSGADFVVIPGYVGILPESKDLVALGNGASDLIAVEIARHTGGVVRLMKSAGSICTTSPEFVSFPKRIQHMTSEHALRMLEYMRPDDQFIQAAAVERAQTHNVVIEFGSMVTPGIVSRIDPAIRQGDEAVLRALPIRDEVTCVQASVAPEYLVNLFSALAESDVAFGDGRASGNTVHIFTDTADADEALRIIRRFDSDAVRQSGTLLTLIDSSMRSGGQHFLRVYTALKDVPPLESWSSGVILHVLVAQEHAVSAANALAEEFGLTR